MIFINIILVGILSLKTLKETTNTTISFHCTEKQHWKRVRTSGTPPKPRYYHSAVVEVFSY